MVVVCVLVCVCVCEHMPKKYLVMHVVAKHEVAVRLFCNKGLLK